MPTLSFKVDEQEEAAIRFRMMVAGETNLSRHLRRLVLNRGNENESLLGDISRKLDKLAASVEHGHHLIRDQASQDRSDVQVSLLAGLYLMLYSAVEPDVRAYADKHLDIAAVRGLLGEQVEGAAPWEVQEATVLEDVTPPQEPPQVPARQTPPATKVNGLNAYLLGRLGMKREQE